MRRSVLTVALALSVGSTLPSCVPSPKEAEVRTLVEAFGSRLQEVTLTSPNVGEEMQAQYSDFVDPTLLEEWIRSPANAPGREVSSPWPDRIEIVSLDEISPDVYSISGEVVENHQLPAQPRFVHPMRATPLR